MTRILLACYQHFLRLYPRSFRIRYGREMQLLMRDYAREHGGVAMGIFLFSDLLVSVPREHFREVNMHRNRRYLWFIPAALAAATASWLIVTPIHVNDFAPLRPFLFSLGQPAAIGFLFLPVFIALLPVLRPRQQRMPTVATLLMFAFIVVATGLAGIYYVPTALAMIVVRFIDKSDRWSARAAV